MLRYYIKTTEALKSLRSDTTEAFKRLRTDQDGVVSFEYLIVAACIIIAVGAAFGLSNGGGVLANALTNGLNAISNKLTNALS